MLAAFLPALLVAGVVGVIHRRAAHSPWLDDLSLALEPGWFQLAAPLWHTPLPGSVSVAHLLTRVIDPFTSASVQGDTRALAAIAVALAAAGLLIVLRRAAVPLLLAFPLCLATVGLVLPVTAMASLAHAVQALAAVAWLVVWTTEDLPRRRRLAWLAVITVIGTLNHPAFLAFSTVFWLAEAVGGDRHSRPGVAIAGVAATAVALASVAWLLTRDMSGATAIVRWPGISDVAIGLLTGRFGAELQPFHYVGIGHALDRCSPGPMVVVLPLALLGCGSSAARHLGIVLGAASLAGIAFVAGTWLPDPTIGGTPARLAMLVLAGMGLRSIAAHAVGGAGVLAVAGAVFLGLGGFLGVAEGAIAADTARMQAFAESGVAAIGDLPWSADRLATTRALLLQAPLAVRATRVPLEAERLKAIAAHRPAVVFVAEGARQLDRDTWIVPGALPFPSAAAFRSSQGGSRWLALAVRGSIGGAFCRDLVALLSQRGADGPNARLVLVTPARRAAAAFEGATDLDVRYGDSRGPAREPAPARFTVESDPSSRIAVNGVTAVQADQGLVLTVFDPERIRVTGWAAGACRSADAPPIDDERLRVGYLLSGPFAAGIPDVPVVLARPVRVPMGVEGNAWFAAGWHGAEGRGEGVVRWTAATSADVNVLVARQRALRVRLTASLAEPPSGTNQLALSWNRQEIPIEEDVDGDYTWTIPTTLVRRGLNVLTVHVTALVSPAALGTSSDTRLLGAAVSRLLLEPLERAPSP